MPKTICIECELEFTQFKGFQKMCSPCYQRKKAAEQKAKRDANYGPADTKSKDTAPGAAPDASSAAAAAAGSAVCKFFSSFANLTFLICSSRIGKGCQHFFEQYDESHLMCQPCYRSFKFQQQKARDAEYARIELQKAQKQPDTTCDVCTQVFTPHFQCRVCHECATKWRGANAQPCSYYCNYTRCERSALPPYPKSQEWMDAYVSPNKSYCGRNADEHAYATRLPTKGFDASKGY